MGGLSRNRIVRLNPDGSVDATFDPGSGVTGLSPVAVYAIAEESHTGIFLGGLFTDYNGLPRLNLVRVHGNPVILQPTRSADSFQVRVQTDRRRTYTLETKDPLDAGAWVPLSNVPGNGSPQTLTDTNASALRRFYRVRVE